MPLELDKLQLTKCLRQLIGSQRLMYMIQMDWYLRIFRVILSLKMYTSGIQHGLMFKYFLGSHWKYPEGTTTALVGESGSGKSTVISLIERFYDPQAGEVLIDSVNIKQFQLKWIRQKIGLVSQEPALFATTIKENIAYGKDGATLEEIQAAAELANAAKFISKMPQVCRNRS
jgi:ABC-type multidrug transport system fused ATPase/permease subunit